MKIGRVLSLPIALVADVVTLGNMGDRSYTQQIFDAERNERATRDQLEALRLVVEALKAASK